MCFSVEVEKEMKKTAQRFNAQVSMADMEYFFALKEKANDTEWIKRALNLTRKPTANIFKLPDNEGGFFPDHLRR